MADATALILFQSLVFYGSTVVFALADQLIINAQPGQTVTLTCQAPTNISVIAEKWTSADLGSDYVIFDKNGKPDDEKQSPTFKNRVNLKDRENGDISLVMTNVSSNDSGTYQCQVFQSATSSWKNISTIKLNVGLPAHRNQSTGDEEKKNKENNDGSNGLVVCAVVVVIGAIIFAIIRNKCLNQNPCQPSTQQAEQQISKSQTSEQQNGVCSEAVNIEMTNLDIKQ